MLATASLTGQSKETDIDEGELPEAPLRRTRRGREELRSRVGLNIQLSPPTEILLYDGRQHYKRHQHNKSLDAIGQGNRAKTTSPLKHENQEHDYYNRIGCKARG